FNPLLPKDKTDRLKWDLEKAKAWIAKGAQPSDRVMRFLDAAGVMKRTKRNNPEKAVPRKERKAKEEAAKAAAGAAPAAPADLPGMAMTGGGRVCLGQIGAATGVSGEVRLWSYTADPEAIRSYGPLETEDGRVVQIKSLRAAKDPFVASLKGVADRNAAE